MPRKNSQTVQVVEAVRKNGGYATLENLYKLLDFSTWKTKTPDATVRRIIQEKDVPENEKLFFNLSPGLWALTECKEDVLQRLQVNRLESNPSAESHTQDNSPHTFTTSKRTRMKITPETKTLATIFPISGDSSYKIPSYQRNFSWKEEHIDTLFVDIRDEEQGYYVGNLLINSNDNEDDVIDGQQRLTTLSLFILAVYEKLGEFRNGDEAQREKIYETRGDIKRHLLSNQKPRLTLLDNDQKVWENLTLVLKGEQSGAWRKLVLYKRYKYVKDELIGKIETLDELLTFYRKLINIEMLQISVTNISDAYQVFASLNSKGEPLTALDVMKNDYISRGGEVKKWNELKNLFAKEENPDETRLTQFVLNNFDAFEGMDSGTSLTKGNLVKAYQALFKPKSEDNPKGKGHNYIDFLIESAKVFLKIANSENAYDYGLSGLAKLDSTTCYPLLMYLLKNYDKHELNDCFADIVKLLVKLYVRRNITLVPKASSLRHELISIKNEIARSNLKGGELYDYVAHEIKRIAPSDSALEVALKEGLYDKNKKTTRFVLISLERKYGKYFHKGNPDSLDDVVGTSGQLRWTIEHILPQGDLPSHWQNAISPEDLSKADGIKEENMNLLGNLTLTPYNAELGTKPFEEKVHYKDSNGNLVGLSLSLFLNESIDKTKKTWTAEDIQKRNEILTKKVLELFAIT